MGDGFQRLIVNSDVQPAVLSLNVQAAMGPVREPQRSQFELLIRHFLERFFNHETASPDGDGKTRLVQLALAAGLPGFMVAVYLWPVYHPVIVYPPHPDAIPGPPPYWVQVNHHFFFVVYSFVVMGLVTVFQWDLFLSRSAGYAGAGRVADSAETRVHGTCGCDRDPDCGVFVRCEFSGSDCAPRWQPIRRT